MRHMFVGLAAIVVSVSAVSAAHQGRNFSGTWTIDLQKTMEARQASGAVGGMIMSGGGGGGVAVARAGGAGGSGGGFGGGMGGGVISAGSGGGGGVAVTTAAPAGDTVITLTATSFTVEIGERRTVYPLNGSTVDVPMGNYTGRAHAAWDGDTLVITTTLDAVSPSATSVVKWSMEGDALVRETASKTYYTRK